MVIALVNESRREREKEREGEGRVIGFGLSERRCTRETRFFGGGSF